MQSYNPNDISHCIMYKARSDSVISTKDLYGLNYNLYDGNNYSFRAFQNSPACLWKCYNQKNKERRTKPWIKSEVQAGIKYEFSWALCDLRCNNVPTIISSPILIFSIIFSSFNSIEQSWQPCKASMILVPS